MSESSLLDAILKPGALSVAFQPILGLDEHGLQLHALECLVRGPKGTNLERADVLFEYVRRKREESLVDRACIKSILKEARGLPGPPHLCINVHASTLGRDHDFLQYVSDIAERCGLPLCRLTVEIVEHSPYWDGPSFLRAVEALRELGVRIALDDVGLGHCNYGMILNCKPDYFKIDRYFVKDTHSDIHRRYVLESVSQLAHKFGAWVVAEGVENASDLNVLISLGISLFQGFLFSRPLSKATALQSALFEEPLTRPAGWNLTASASA
jgi:EAL domain-containing protein (putative c-di-GMP-specific phosphodiesterase class I)